MYKDLKKKNFFLFFFLKLAFYFYIYLTNLKNYNKKHVFLNYNLY